jgi:hypothetical protein
MTHLTIEQLLAVREPGLEPGVAGWRDHASACDLCRAELERLDQRVARLRALPALRPARNRFVEIRMAAHADRRRKRWMVFSAGAVTVAASLALAVVLTRGPSQSEDPAAQQIAEQHELDSIIASSRSLEGTIQAFHPERRVTDGRTASVAASLEDRLARVDDQLQLVDMMDQSVRQEAALRLWRERVGLLNALVDVHATRARAVGF